MWVDCSDVAGQSFSVLKLELCGWTSGYSNLWEKDNFLLMVPQIKLQRSSWSEVPWASALIQGGRWHHSLSLWYSSLFFLWWHLKRSSYQIMKGKTMFFSPGSFNINDQNGCTDAQRLLSTVYTEFLELVSWDLLGNLLRGKNSIDSPQNSPHMPCNGVTHADGAAPFPSFSVLTCTLVIFSEHFPWASSLTEWGKSTPQCGGSSFSVHPGRYFCTDYIWWTSVKSPLESL